MKALCFGSLNIDDVYKVPHFVSRGETLAASDCRRFCGGKGLNQAVALARAGMDTWMAGAIGTDGAFLVEELRASGVDTRFVKTIDCPTGHAVIQNTPDGDNCILLFGGANRCITTEYAAQVLSAFTPGDLLLLQNEISSLPEIISLAREKGLRIALNPSPMEPALLAALMGQVDYLLLNRLEAEQILRSSCAEPMQLLRALACAYPGVSIVLTLGEGGALFFDGEKIYSQNAFPVPAVDTTGAGDTFTGFFLASLLRSGAAQDALRLASAAAAIAVTRPGASPSIPSRKEVKMWLDSGCSVRL